MLTTRQKSATALCALGAVIMILLLGVFGPKPIPAVANSPVESRFDGQSAIDYTRVLSVDYPDRFTGSLGARRAAQYIRSEFEKLGYQVEVLPLSCGCAARACKAKTSSPASLETRRSRFR